MGVTFRERPKGSGIWWVFINHQGQRKAKKVGPNKELAKEVAEKINARLVLGEFDLDEKEASCPTLRQYAYGWTGQDGQVNIGWLDKHARLALKRSTVTNYESILATHIIPEVGSLPLDDITPRVISEFLKKCFDKGLRSKTVKNIKNCLGSTLSFAYQPDGYIESNPAQNVKVPKPEAEIPAREPNPFSWQDRKVLEDYYLENMPRYYPLILTGFRTGLRIGELFGLQWCDVDFKNKILHVQRNVTRGRVTTPKSQSGRRSVRMTSQLINELESLLTVRKQEKLKRGWDDMPGWVFCNDSGGFLDYGNFLHRTWNRSMEKSGLLRRTPHDMRHTYATLRLSKGDSLAEVSKEMGHSSSDITYRTYYKWLPSESLTDIDELDNAQPSATQAQPAKKRT
jgi:integrase